ncbi:MAG: DUF3349 domain-containing protein [Mycolicibacterium sp.]|nr:DUF3349 domain-containing protein [Mycolicibacterium sp.]
MALPHVLARVVNFLRAGYPEGVPQTDYIPLLALLRRRLSDEEVVAVASELAAQGLMPIEAVDIGVAITKITHEMPSQPDIDRVKARLEASGWQISDPFDLPPHDDR